MKTTRIFSKALFVLFITNALLFAQKSDRAIVDKFEQTVKALAQATETAKTVQDCAEISASLKELEMTFAPNKDLLDKALYPDDFTKSITNLKGRLLVRQSDLGVIETQIVHIAEWEAQVKELSGKVDSLTQSNAQLFSETKRLEKMAATDKAMIDSLSAVVSKLQQNLKARDQLIFALVDSLFQQYDKNVVSMNDVEKQGVAGKLERRNVLTNIKKSIADNIQFLESTSLTAKDYAEIERQHHKFESQWKGIGSKLAAVYLNGKQKKNDVAEIDTMLGTWSSKVNEGTWKALTALLQKGGISIKPFASGSEFYQNFSAYLDEEIKNPKDEPKDVRSKRFENFNTVVWTTDLDPTWLPVLAETGKITADQKADIEKKVDAWRNSVTSASWIYYLLIAVVLVVIVIAVGKFMKKKPKV